MLPLTSLDLGSNELTDVSFLQKLTALTSLNLKSNQITEIPRWLTEKGLEIQIDDEYASGCINLYDNPIENPPIQIVRQGNEAIRNYYDQIAAQGEDYLYAAKMLIVGEGEAGKTTLAHKIADPDCPLPHIDDRTRGITIHPHSFTTRAKDSSENREFQLNVWDFGGQEMYHATHHFFLSRRSLYVLVADNRKDNTDFNYWLNIIEYFAGKSPIIILLNEKDDLQRNINQSEMRSRYPESIKEVIKLNFKTAEETDQNKRQIRLKKIHELINQIEHHAAHLPHIGEPVPAHWVNQFPNITPIPPKKTMKTIRIFLASSAELKSDREQFEIFINRKNKEYIKKEIFLELVLWKNFLDAMSATRLQDEYNKVIAECDIFISLFHTKVGKYTEEEFSKAFATFKENNKPFIYTYFKDTPINTSKITSEILSLLNFKEKLKELGHFQTDYADISDLKYQFDQQLIKLSPHFED